MTYDAPTMYRLLPAIHRIRDEDQGQPLEQLLALVAEQVAVLEENLDQLYDDQFIETCAEWVVPYIGTLIGYRTLHGVAPRISSPRAEVANTIAFRRRKGTAAMLEQVAGDVTGWPARVVEMFAHLATTQYMNHVRPEHAFTPDLRRWEPLERLGTAFDSLAHTVETRSIERGGGRYNIPNIGVFLWRLAPYRLKGSPAVRVDARRFRFSPLGDDTPLFTRHQSEDRITHLAEPINVPQPISRRVLSAHLADHYGQDLSILVEVDGAALARSEVKVCDLSDVGAGAWGHMPTDKVAIDPVLGRIAFPADVAAGARVLVTYHYGFSADIGGGTYERGTTFGELKEDQVRRLVPDDFSTIQAALDDLPAAGGVVEVTDSGRYEETLSIDVAANASVEIRAANEHRPTLVLAGDLEVAGGDGAAATLNGLLIAGGGVDVPDTAGNELQHLTVRHCTLVPGRALGEDGTPQQPAAASLQVGIADLTVTIENSLVGSLRVVDGCETSVTDSIVDATATTRVAYAGPVDDAGNDTAGGELTLKQTTVVGKVYADRLTLVSNSILHAALDEPDDWPAPVRAERKQEGCLRFSYVPPTAIAPRRFRCQPQLAIDREIARREQELGTKLPAAERDRIAARLTARLVPGFTALRYGHPGYGQLSASTPSEIRTGADDESEMGVFHLLYQPQRETNLRVRFEEYLRFGLQAGIFYEG